MIISGQQFHQIHPRSATSDSAVQIFAFIVYLDLK